MTARRFTLPLASAAALTLAVYESALSVSPVEEPTLSTTTATVAAESATIIKKSPTADESVPARAEVTLPPPLERNAAAAWRVPRPEARRGITPEERRAYWEQRLQKRRDRTMRRHQKIQESMERWGAYWKTWDAMTPEQKEAVHAIFGFGHQQCAHHAKDPRLSPRLRLGRPDFGLPAGSAFTRPGYRYSPRHVRPPYPPFDGNPAAALTLPGGVQPRNNRAPGAFLYPNPPGTDVVPHLW